MTFEGNELSNEIIARLIEHLEKLRQAPHLFSGKQPCGDLPATWIYLEGFRHACQILGVDLSDEWKIFEERGWGNTTLPDKKMRQQGLDNQAVTNEILAILIETLNRRYFERGSNNP